MILFICVCPPVVPRFHSERELPAFVLSASGSTPKGKCDFLCLRPFRAPQNGLANALYLQPAYKAADARVSFGDAPHFSAENRINPCAAQKSIVGEKKEKIFSVREKRQNRLCPRRRCAAAGRGSRGCGRRGRRPHTGRPLRRGLSAALVSAKKDKCLPRTNGGAAGLLRQAGPRVVLLFAKSRRTVYARFYCGKPPKAAAGA